MPDLARFGVFMAAAFLLFFGVVRWVVRRRTTKPATGVLLALATVVVPIGMLFAVTPTFSSGISRGRSTMAFPR